MIVWEYLAQLDAKLQELAEIIVDSSIQREVDASLGIGFIKGRLAFLDGSVKDRRRQRRRRARIARQHGQSMEGADDA